jgi:hypothetical protein
MTDEPSTKPRKRRDIVADWREKHLHELDKTLEVWKSVRDDPDSSDKDRIEAGKAIARLLGAMSPESPKAAEKSAVEAGGIVQPHHKPEVEKELQELLESIK